MNFTFGIITGGNEDLRINQIIDSIENENIPNYEIIIVGGEPVGRNNTHVFKFDETMRPMWITRKKNAVTQNAKYENIVYMHDYLALEPGWYEGWLKFVSSTGGNYAVAMNKILNADGSRFRDWCIWDIEQFPGINGRARMLPYDITHLSKYMYFSGAYWVAKKNVMIAFPLDERLVWAQGEDVLWSQQIRQTFNFTMQPNSTVKIIKDWKDPAFTEMSPMEQAIARAHT